MFEVSNLLPMASKLGCARAMSELSMLVRIFDDQK